MGTGGGGAADGHGVPAGLHPLTDLAGIEIYSSGQTPIEPGGTGAFCGTLVLWTH